MASAGRQGYWLHRPRPMKASGLEVCWGSRGAGGRVRSLKGRSGHSLTHRHKETWKSILGPWANSAGRSRACVLGLPFQLQGEGLAGKAENQVPGGALEKVSAPYKVLPSTHPLFICK